MDNTSAHDWHRPARRSDRTMNKEDALALLDRAEYGVLAMADGQGRPYAVPINYGRDESRVYFHCAHEGQKLDILRANPEAVLCVTEAGAVTAGDTPCETTVSYRSVLVFGRITELTSMDAKLGALDIICRHHGIAIPPAGTPAAAAYAKRATVTVVLAMEIEHVSGKMRA